MALSRNPECPICGDAPTQTGLIDYEEFCGLHSGDAPGATETDMAPDEISEIDPSELAERLATAEPPFLLDVREPYEWNIANLEDGGAVLIPLGEVQDRLDEIPTDREVVVYCRSGQRSAAAVRTLLAAGLPRVHNLRGGVLAWADDIDPSLTKY